MAVDIIMPQLSDTMNEGTILSWSKNVGDTVAKGDELAEVGTDKADLPVEAFHEGVLLKIYAKEGETVKVGSVIAVIGQAGESVSDSASTAPAKSKAQAPAAKPAAAPQSVAAPAEQQPVTNGQATSSSRVKISPLAKNLAQSHGLDVSALRGSGEGGRIVRRDIEQAITGGSAQAPRPGQAATVQYAAARPVAQTMVASTQHTPGQLTVQPLSKMRQTIASRMVEAVNTIPHFYLTTAVEADALKRTRESLKPLPAYEGVTFNHLIIRAVALALRAVPRINARYQDSNLVQPQDINIGIITAVDDGLLIPVLKNADQLPLVDIVGEGKALVQRARSGRPKSDDLLGATFCISNVGAFAVESFTAVISPGNGAILAVGAMAEEAIVKDGTIRAGNVMRLTLSVDHRIIDGVVGAQFLTELKGLLEDPVLLLA